MSIKKLIVKEFTTTGEESPIEPGFKYSYFVDPETGKYYRPRIDFQVTGENLEDLFEEVEPNEEE